MNTMTLMCIMLGLSINTTLHMWAGGAAIKAFFF